jgi:hypothetical protein
MEHDLDRVLFIIKLQESEKVQRSTHATSRRVIIAGDDEDLPKTRFEVLVNTVESAIEYLEEQEVASER